MKGESCLDNITLYNTVFNLVHVMQYANVNSLPLNRVENWTDSNCLTELIDSGILIIEDNYLKLNIDSLQRMVSQKILQKTGISFPPDLSNCIGPPWNPDRRYIVNCRPKLQTMINSVNPVANLSIERYVYRTMNGVKSENIDKNRIKKVVFVPVYHEGDFLQYPKVKRAILHHDPDFVGVEGLGPIGTRYLLFSLFTLRALLGFPYCIIMKDYFYVEDRIRFFTGNPKDFDAVKACIAAEGDFAAVTATCLGQNIPFFPMGVPEECIGHYFPDFFEVEKNAWHKCCKHLEREAKEKSFADLDSLCRNSSIKEMEDTILKGRISASHLYKKQLLWSENYMLSRIHDFLELHGGDYKIVIFVGLCHCGTMRSKANNGSWQYIPPINQNVVPKPYGFAPSKIAAYIQLFDKESNNFLSRFERAVSPSPLYAELFGMSEYAVIESIRHNLRNLVVTNNIEEIKKGKLAEFMREFRKTDPQTFNNLMTFAENYFAKNGFNRDWKYIA